MTENFIFQAQSFQLPIQNQVKLSLIEWQNQSRSIDFYLSMGLGFIEGVLIMLSLQMIKALIYAGIGGKRWESLSWLAFPFCILNLLLFFALMKIHLIQMSILLKVLCWLVHLLTLIIFVVKGSQWADQEA